jgi:VCBS repeat-containing protein
VIINLQFDADALAAPQSFRDGMLAAAAMLDAHLADNITVNIGVSYGTFNGAALPNQNTSEGNIGSGGNGSGYGISYSDLRTALANDATTSDDNTAVANLPGGSSIGGQSSFLIGNAQARALGLVSANDGTQDGWVGMGTGFTGNVLFAGAIHELTHALGRIAGTGLDIYRFNEDNSGNHVFGGAIPATPAYFSIDGGTTNLADFGINSDPGDFLNGGVQGPDPDNESVQGRGMTPVDMTMEDVLGFDAVNAAPTVSALSASVGEDGPSFQQDLLSGASDPDGDDISIAALAGSVITALGRTLNLGTDYILTGSTLALTSTGFSKFNSLAQGVSDTAVFGFQVRDFLAAITPNTQTLTIVGANDNPALGADGGSPHALTELAGTTNSTTPDVAIASMSFSDVDIGDTHTGDAGLSSGVWSGGVTVPAATMTALNTAMGASVIVDGTSGTVSAIFSLQDKFADFLAVGETLTATYDVEVRDNHSGVSNARPVTIVITGANDVPTVNGVGSVLANSLSEEPNVTGSNDTDTTSGQIAFNDPDLNDRPTASIDTADQTATWQDASNTFALSAGQIAMFTSAINITPAAGNANDGTINWNYAITDKKLDFLAVGETVIITTPIIVDDHHGGTVTPQVVVTINGANDNPIAAVDTNGTAKNSTLSVSAAHGVLANDFDPDVHDNGHLFVSQVNGSAGNVGTSVTGTYGSVTLNGDGSYTYVANRGALPAKIVAVDTFAYTVADPHGGTDTSALRFIVSNPGVNYLAGANTVLGGGNGPNVLDGTAGGDTLIGGNGPDVLVAGPGNSMNGGNGPDTFLFLPEFGSASILDFKLNNDKLQFDKSIFASAAAVLSHTIDSPSGAVITDTFGETVRLAGVTVSQLAAHIGDIYIA